METTKYYTPDVSEFHIGFEYEMKEGGDKWNNYILDACDMRSGDIGENAYVENGFDLILQALSIENIRVKYLDREDIESLGWKIGKVIVQDDDENDTWSDGFSIYIENMGWFELVKISDENFYIQKKWYRNHLTQMCRTVFYGNILNKSDLKKLMQMLNIK